MENFEEIHEILRKIVAEWVKMSQNEEKCDGEATPA
jgi:hypothetical protein